MKGLVHVSGPPNPGPGERRRMLDRAAQVFADAGMAPSEIVRIDVPGRGESEAGEAAVRPEVAPMVPAIQSGSLFGGRTGVMVVDAQQLRAAEAAAAADLLGQPGAENRLVVLVSGGRLPAPLGGYAGKHGEKITVGKLRDRDAHSWVREGARKRGVKLGGRAAGALVERFGADLGSLDQALDQLASAEGPVSGEMIRDRFRNRPDQPAWRLTEAVASGSIDESLRRLRDLLVHNHPLVLLAVIENDLRRRALAAAAPDIRTFADWIGARPDAFPTKKSWEAGRRVDEGGLTKALDAVRRADRVLKTMPEETHRVTLERLTAALCFWYRR